MGFCVYKHTSPSGKIYVGITSQLPNRRWQNGFGYTENPYFYSAIQKYGWDNFKHEILFEDLTKEEAEIKEIELIAQYDSTNRERGYNISSGGGINYPSEEGRQRLRELWTGHVFSDEVRQKISQTQKGKIISPETRAKMSTSHKGKKMSLETRLKVDEAKHKAVLCVETGEVFKRMKDAQIKYKTAHISAVCKGYRKTAGGYSWCYVERSDFENGGRKTL